MISRPTVGTALSVKRIGAWFNSHSGPWVNHRPIFGSENMENNPTVKAFVLAPATAPKDFNLDFKMENQ